MHATRTKKNSRQDERTGKRRTVTAIPGDLTERKERRLSPAKVFAFINHKGGVGKTSTATHCAGVFAEAGQRVLLIDCDSQGNLSSLFLPGHEERKSCVAHLFAEQETDPNDVITESVFDNIWIMPCDARLNLVDETHGFEQDDRVFAIKGAIQSVQDRFDLILLDGSPSPHLSSFAAMVCADEIFVPCEASVFSLEGLPSIQSEIASVRERFNDHVRVRYFLSRTKSRGSAAELCRAAMVQQLGEEAVFQNVIPDLVTYNSAVNRGRHVIAHAKNCRAADYIRRFAQEMLQPYPAENTGVDDG